MGWALIMALEGLTERVARLLGARVREAGDVKVLVVGELERVRAEKKAILEKYGVKDFEELWRLIEEGVLSDVDAHEDIVRLDYLEHLEEQLEELLEELKHAGERA